MTTKHTPGPFYEDRGCLCGSCVFVRGLRPITSATKVMVSARVRGYEVLSVEFRKAEESNASACGK